MTFNRTRCPQCKKKLEQGQRIHTECIDAWSVAQEEKLKRKAEKERAAAIKKEKASIRKWKQENKKIPELIKEAQHAFNAYIRKRDENRPCICCGNPLRMGGIGGGFDAGHYRSTGSASHLRFNEDNVHGQRKYCNQWGAGRAVDYRLGLINRIGLQRVEALESNNTVHKWSADELREIKERYKQKLKELQNEQ